jgi:hypothetical protein
MLVGTARDQNQSGEPEANTLAYYENPYITAVISFIVQAPGPNVIKILFVIYSIL